MAIIRDANYRRIQDLTNHGVVFYPRTTTDAVWDFERLKTLAEILDDIDEYGGGGGSNVLWGELGDGYTTLNVNNVPRALSILGHRHQWTDIWNTPDTLLGYGIVDAYTKSLVDNLIGGNIGLLVYWTNVLDRPSWIGSSKPTYTKSEVGLGSVDNTSDANKPISSAMQLALNAKLAILQSSVNIKTINGQTILGSGNLVIQGGGSSSWGSITGAIQSQTDLLLELNSKANATHTHQISLITDFPERLNLIAGDNIDIVEQGNDVIISSTGGGGEDPADRINLQAGAGITIQESGNSLVLSSDVGDIVNNAIDVESIAIDVNTIAIDVNTIAVGLVAGDNVSFELLPNGDIEISSIGGGGSGAVDSVNGQTGVVVLDKEDIGLGNVDDMSLALIEAGATDIGTILSDVAFSGDYNDLSNKLIAGANITIDALTNTISSSGGGGGAVNSVNTRLGDVVLTSADVGLGNVDNTSDLDKPVSTATTNAITNSAQGLISDATDLTSIAGYNASVKQYLTHDSSGVLSWENS